MSTDVCAVSAPAGGIDFVRFSPTVAERNAEVNDDEAVAAERVRLILEDGRDVSVHKPRARAVPEWFDETLFAR